MEKHHYNIIGYLLVIAVFLLPCMLEACPPVCHYQLSRIKIKCNCSSLSLHSFPNDTQDVKRPALILDASHNFIEVLKSNGFIARIYHKVEILFLDRNLISEIESTAFRNLYHLKTLNISHNNITHLDSIVFTKTPNIEEIFLNDNNLTLLQSDVFETNSDLQIVDFSNNKLSVLSFYIFRNNTHLREINLSNNYFSYINERQFQSNPYLQVLHLQGNKLLSIQSNAFRHNAHLMFLDLSRNRISYLHEDLLRENCLLKNLDISENVIDTLPVSKEFCFKKELRINICQTKIMCSEHLEETLDLYRNTKIHIMSTCKSEMSCRFERSTNSSENLNVLQGNSPYLNSDKLKSTEYMNYSIRVNKNLSETSTNVYQESVNMVSIDTEDTGFIENLSETSTNVYQESVNFVSIDTEDIGLIENSSLSTDYSFSTTTIIPQVVSFEYDSPLVVKESTVRGYLFIGIELLLTCVIILRKCVFSKKEQSPVMVDTVELLSDCETKAATNNETEEKTETQSV